MNTDSQRVHDCGPRLSDPKDYDNICIAPEVHFADDDDSLIAHVSRVLCDSVERNKLKPESKFVDIEGLCKDGLTHLKFHKGVQYEFAGTNSLNVPVFSDFGYGFHLNFFARPKFSSRVAAHVMFLEVAFGDPPKVIRCVPVPHIPYYHGDLKKYATDNVYHPEDDEVCSYCEHAKDGSLRRNFCLPPPYPIA